MPNTPPVVLCLSGHDPTGGAGIQADIQALSAIGCHPCSVITALTVQDTCNVRSVSPQAPQAFLAQARTLIADLPIAAVKLGLLGSADIARASGTVIRELGDVPVVLDPVLAAGGGAELATAELLAAIRGELLPLTTVLTPNSIEARRLAGGPADLDACGDALLRMGCRHVLITGSHERDAAVVNRLYGASGMQSWRWQRLPYDYHGSGCTLAAALAGFLARGHRIEDAATAAQELTWRALAAAHALGRGQHLPNRFSSLEMVLARN